MNAAPEAHPAADRFAWVPSPLAIALGLTAVTAVAALFVGADLETVATTWRDGLWNRPLLVFAFQAAFMLVLGHALALSPAADRGIQRAVNLAGTTNARAAAVVAVVACLAGWINWGLGLIIGAVLARKVGERAAERGLPFHYGLIGAAGYSGLMVWHGGLSGSAPIKVAEAGHLSDIAGIAGIDPALLPGSRGAPDWLTPDVPKVFSDMAVNGDCCVRRVVEVQCIGIFWVAIDFDFLILILHGLARVPFCSGTAFAIKN